MITSIVVVFSIVSGLMSVFSGLSYVYLPGHKIEAWMHREKMTAIWGILFVLCLSYLGGA